MRVVGQADAGGARPGIEEHVLPSRRGRLRRMLSGPLVFAEVSRMTPGAVGVHTLELLPWAALYRWLTGVPVTYDSNEDYAAFMLVKEWLPRWARRPLSRLVGWAEPWLAKRLDAVTVADLGTAEKFQRRGVRALVVRNFAWRDMVPEVVEARPTHDVLYHGTLPPYYRDHIVATARALRARGRRLRWCVAVRDSLPGDRRELEAALDAAGVRDDFTLRENLPFSQMPGLIADARLGFIPWPDEPKFRVNFPRKIFELMAMGRPVVVSDLPPVRNLLGDLGCVEMARPGDAEAYADAILSVLDDPGRAEEMGATGRRLVLERFNADTELAPYVQMYEGFLRGSPATRAGLTTRRDAKEGISVAGTEKGTHR